MKKTKRARRVFDPQEKVTAVLSVWTECRTATQVCREMSVSWTLLDKWQNQAMEGMLTALSPIRAEHKATLSSRLVRLMEKKLNGTGNKLQKRPEKNPEQQKEKTTITEETFHGQIQNGHETSRTNYESELWPDDGNPGSQGLEGLAKDVLQMGEEGPYCLVGQCHRSTARPPRDKAEQGAGTVGEKIKTGHETKRSVASQNGPERHFIRNKTWFRRPGQKKIKPSQKQFRRSEH